MLSHLPEVTSPAKGIPELGAIQAQVPLTSKACACCPTGLPSQTLSVRRECASGLPGPRRDPQQEGASEGASQWLFSESQAAGGRGPCQAAPLSSLAETRDRSESSVYAISSPTCVFLFLCTTLSRLFLILGPRELPVSKSEPPARPGRKNRGLGGLPEPTLR